MMAEIIRGRSSVRGVAGTKRMALVGVALVAALSAALLVVSGVGPGAAEAQTAQTSGTVVAWGSNAYGQPDIPPNLTGVEAISAGAEHSLALVVDTQDTTAPTIQAALDPASPVYRTADFKFTK